MRTAITAIIFLGSCAGPCTSVSVPPAPGDGTLSTDVELWYRVSGRGPVAILPTPGWGPSAELYFLSMQPLEEMFTVVYLDTRGSGRSGRPAPEAYAWSNFVADLDALRAHLGLAATFLVGHSAGGAMVLHYAATHPKRVRGLVVIDGLAATDEVYGADRSRAVASYQSEPWFERARAGFAMEVSTDEELRRMLEVVTPLYFARYDNIEKLAPVFEKTTFSAAAYQGTQKSGFFPFDLRDRLPGITAPTLVLVGRADAICPVGEAKRIHDALPNSTLVEIEGGGHFPWIENPPDFYRGLRTGLANLGVDLH